MLRALVITTRIVERKEAEDFSNDASYTILTRIPRTSNIHN